jgi:hypothetical protein
MFCIKGIPFTNDLPNEPGFYLWSENERSTPFIVTLELFSGVLVDIESGQEVRPGGLWCHLAPAAEVIRLRAEVARLRVEIEAAWSEALHLFGNHGRTVNSMSWELSRAKRVKDGLE